MIDRTNIHVKLMMGGSYTGGMDWTKAADDIDKCFKIYHFRQGESIIYSCDNQYVMNPGKVYFINGHAITGQECRQKMSLDWLHFIPESLYLDHILRTFSCVYTFDASQLSSFLHIFERIKNYFDDELPENERGILRMEVHSLIQYLIAQILKDFGNEIMDKDDRFKRLQPAMEYINNNYRSGISLDILAELCSLSPNYFDRLFNQTFHITPFNYIRERRLADASSLLLYSSKQIKEIAYETGYGDAAYFSRLFSKVYHESPRSYRMNKRRDLP
jgi:AraC-like DNA-binding protein